MKFNILHKNTMSKRMHPSLKKSKQTGATLIEVLVAVLILSFGLLGMAALQTRALQGNQSSLQRSQASMLSHYMMDAMRIDRENARGGAYNTGANFVCGPDSVSGSTLAANNTKDWLTVAETNLGVASDTTTCGSIACDGDFVCTVSIRWDDSKAGGLGEQTLTITSKI
jgi:type IV pilus assembly protein PilV